MKPLSEYPWVRAKNPRYPHEYVLGSQHPELLKWIDSSELTGRWRHDKKIYHYRFDEFGYLYWRTGRIVNRSRSPACKESTEFEPSALDKYLNK